MIINTNALLTQLKEDLENVAEIADRYDCYETLIADDNLRAAAESINNTYYNIGKLVKAVVGETSGNVPQKKPELSVPEMSVEELKESFEPVEVKTEEKKRTYKRVTNDQKQKIKDLYETGMNAKEISDALGLQYKTVYSNIQIMKKKEGAVA